MKFLRHGAPGAEKPGLLDTSGRVRDLSDRVPDIAGQTLGAANLKALQDLDIDSLPVVEGTPQEDLRLGPCVGGIGKFICIGLNYADHAEEAGMPIPKEPIIFNKWTSAVVGPNDAIQVPRHSVKTDWEVELGVVIGDPGVYIDEADAMRHVAGLCVINDVSEREFQNERAGTWDKGKGCDTFGPTGPWLVTLDEISDVNALELWLDVDGDRMQTGSTATLIFNVPQLVSYCSQFMSLQPGDVISTGTPPGVGMGQSPQRFLHGGETVSLGITGLGEQRSSVLPAG
ncbi:fumarylacetoacetate hydrolase family protein [Spiribacter vilamensis]|uniref:2,4-diketo-3-deoxy-L-fuconate hydrolase n=1 Tax=Spiribacter vilamensis TaxID=531306 RepID=A0A4Q8CZE2_9GAMM|nr:fumarylacetoacetate hydrolase family protein [Spiribacter vilamensis]RZU98396.1 2,4-diketo-3-deoxy-L-fuconate hydrolase [Spiribacter vilamensis]TVO60723.1 fumarylacetoacetate hydrolase family protein [Spiribacter vilamensis]